LLDAKPLEHCPAPAYPTRRDFLAAGAALLLAAGCGRSDGPRATVAPIFEHGEGRGSDGCVVMTPPVFLSEEEALQVIKEELAKHDVHLGGGMWLGGVEIQWVNDDRISHDWLGTPRERSVSHVALDAVDPTSSVGVEFVSHKSYAARLRWIGTVAGYDTKAVADRVAAEIRKQSKDRLRIGVFYDPLTKLEFHLEDKVKAKAADTSSKQWETSGEDSFESATAKSKVLLRRQVADFATWLGKRHA
jgi:hypothetical protein